MKTGITSLCFLLLAISTLADEKHPIEVEMDKAMDQNPSTAGQIEAITNAQAKWDELLNKHYQTLTKDLEPEAVKALRESQRTWISWRDRELKSLRTFYSKMDGTMYVPMAAYAGMNLTRQRALSLERLASMVNERGLVQ
ncbi:MAG: DUF1311 domain-containing protein [Verrucomicrobiales bacterium]|nr:DUF1311 domain-containing protein [Verrucomicrobiales bacterium]